MNKKDIRLAIKRLDDGFDSNRVITNPDPLNKDNTFNEDGVFSETLFGVGSHEEGTSYQCKCGHLKGRFMEGIICEECGEPVSYTEPTTERYGWIDLGKYEILSPLFYYQFSHIIGRKELDRILRYEASVDKDGNPQVNPDYPYRNLGISAFKEKYIEVLDYYYNHSTKKEYTYNLIMNNQDKLFTNKIPVFHPMLRPASIGYQDRPILTFEEINKYYNYIIRVSNKINEDSKDQFTMAVEQHLYKVQKNANNIFDKIIDNISGKNGFIRSHTMGNRVNFSARNVITPLPPHYPIYGVSLPYLTFVELYTFHIINILCAVKNISEVKAKDIVTKAKAKFDPEIYSICQELIKRTKHGCMILLNRNPSIEYGSMLCLKVVEVKDDYNDLTTGINNLCLNGLAGDYDGDVLNIIALMDNRFKKIFYDIFSPVNMFVSRDNGRFNSNLNLDRDHVLGIHVLNKARNNNEQ